MGWSFRKSLRLLPGVRVNLSKSGPRLSVGIPGVRANIGLSGKARIYGGKGPLRFQKTVDVGHEIASGSNGGLLSILRTLFRKQP